MTRPSPTTWCFVLLGCLASAPPSIADGQQAAPSGGATQGSSRHPLADRAEEVFFNALLREPAKRDGAERILMAAFAADSTDARTNLLLGLLHLWVLAEGPGADALVLEHALLGDYHFSRYAKLNPSDHRLASWHVPIQLTLAAVEKTPGKQAALMSEFQAAYDRDPAFHSVSLAMQSFHRPTDSAQFRNGRELLRRAHEQCAHAQNPDCMNKPRWPHNVQGFSLLRADYALRAGDLKEAEALLRNAPREPGWASFPFKVEVEKRLGDLRGYATRLANGDPATPMVTDPGSGIGCQVCHRAE